MIVPDVNLLLYAFREDSPQHAAGKEWLEALVNSPQPYGLFDLALSGFLRIATHPSIFNPPSPLNQALEFVEALRTRPNAVVLGAGPRHWALFTGLCKEAGAKGSLIPDAYFAALAIENGAEWATSDRDYARFTGLKWRNPLKT